MEKKIIGVERYQRYLARRNKRKANVPNYKAKRNKRYKDRRIAKKLADK